ncbi:hypothetical protein [Microbacterium sp.]|uniref:hypothetical protein n=1 Tax=Microbacterium sp. TaxID=51671 RepID=UPI003F98B6C1
MTNTLFSTYRGGENRVTSSTLAVFERIDLGVVRELLQNAAGMGEELRAVSFENQVVEKDSVPDARIAARFTWWFETKTTRHGYDSEGHDRTQVRRHASRLVGDPDAYLFVLTPDANQPAWFAALDGVDPDCAPRVVWFSFAELTRAIRELLEDATRLVSEQTRFLLRELTSLYEADGLLSSDDTVIVAARNAWPEYERHAAYICQPDRAFRADVSHFGFYAQGQIMPTVARIDHYLPSVQFSAEGIEKLRATGEQRAADLVSELLAAGTRDVDASYGVMLLSGPQDPDTIHLPAAIKNDTQTATGRGWAWTLGQRYTELARLTSGATRTSQL